MNVHLSPERWILEEELGGKQLEIWLLATGCPPRKQVGNSSDMREISECIFLMDVYLPAASAAGPSSCAGGLTA